ncbi:MAG: ribonuclease [Cyanobacteria bacterium RYN_339]|nr:ribonuclease [Cyanobacteria bacterium RYN_339]
MIQVIPLGGVGEIGKNMWCVRSPEGIIVLDCGFAFPTEEMYGVDLVLPDYKYLVENADLVRGVFISHGHEDHIGGLPYFLKRVPVPVYATPLTIGLIQGKLQEHNVKVPLHCMNARDRVTVGDMDIEFIQVCHSIADAVAIAVHTPTGTVLYTGDFKFDPTPIDNRPTDYFKLTELGEKGLLLLMSDSTNVTKKGFTPSEAAVAPALDAAFAQAPGRLIITTFASNIHRVQQILNAAARHGRKVALMGRSMLKVTQIAHDLGYLKYDDDLILDVDKVEQMPPEQVVMLATGSQGEPMAALSRLATMEYKGVSVTAGDTVLISAIPIPGNERSVGRIINSLVDKGANVLYESVQQGTHVSGHGSEEELKAMIAMTRPKFFIPMHGESRHLAKHAALARSMGVPEDNIAVCQNGDVVELDGETIKIVDRVPGGPVLVDGNVLWDVGQTLLKDRQRLARDGVATTVVTVDGNLDVLQGPDIVTRGFIDSADSQLILDEGKRRVVEVIDAAKARGTKDPEKLKGQIVETLSRYFGERTRRRPVQLVVIHQIKAEVETPG